MERSKFNYFVFDKLYSISELLAKLMTPLLNTTPLMNIS